MTSTRIALAAAVRSASVTWYVCVVIPVGVQSSGAAATHRSHRYVRLPFAAPVQTPGSAVRMLPSWSPPLIDGSVVATGTWAPSATVPNGTTRWPL